MASRSTGASRTLLAVIVGALVAVTLLVLAATRAEPVDRSVQRIPVDGGRISLDTTLFTPDSVTADAPAPAVLLAHGFGGSKRSVTDDALALARDGYVVLTWSARGFGGSGGRIALNAPDAEIADVSALIDWLAERPEVRRDGPDDPRVGMTGASYGGGATLLAAAADARIDAIAPIAAWHSLVSSLAPDAAGDPPGVFKQQWASLLFTSGAAPQPPLAAGGQPVSAADGQQPPAADEQQPPAADEQQPPAADGQQAPAAGEQDADAGERSRDDTAALCGRFTRAICDAYADSAEAGVLTPEAAALLRRADLDGALGDIAAPTLLVHAEADTLFPLAQSVANARGIARTDTPLKLVWIPGGHNLSATDGNVERVRTLTADWFDRWLRGNPSTDTGPVFEWADRASGSDRAADTITPETTARGYALSGDGRLVRDGSVTSGDARSFASPPGGAPAALTSLPGLGALGGALPPTDVPGQHVAFETPALEQAVQVLGAPRLQVTVDTTADDAVLFAKIYDVAPDGLVTLPQQAVAPVRVSSPPATATVQLPTLAHRFPPGHRIRLVLSSTDQAYANAQQAGVVTVETGPDTTLTLPTIPPPAGGGFPLTLAVAGGLLLVAAAAVAAALMRRRHADGTPRTDRDAVVVRGLRKAYDDGLVAVDGIDLQVPRGQVFGLLGPNGAGKTTTLRMLLGLITPTAGEVELLGHRITPGHPVLRHVGALVEGPGFAPYLSGRDNLVSYWRAGGRPLAEARLDEALAVAALGDAIDRPVRTYSHGMRQRLGIAQALLGDPQLLVLDEPTDGLDPGQIRGMRELLAGLATGGRTVLLSSHLLAEVEQVCTHVAVMDAGRVVAAGPVAELGGETRSLEITTDDRPAAEDVLVGLLGPDHVRAQGPGLLVDLDGRQPPDLVDALVAAGVRVRTVTPRRRLEDAFLRLVESDRS